MKKIIKIFSFIIVLGVIFLGCSKDEINELDGETNIPLNQVGNTFQGGVLVNGVFVPSYNCEIVESTNGVASVRMIYDFQSTTELGFINDLISSDLKDSDGRLNTIGKVKITSEGIMDYTNSDDAPFVLVKYDAKVGDKYILEKSNGQTITRKVTSKSTEDDFDWGLMMIKVTTIEQDSRIPGISKIIYKTNHKFGLVYVEAIAEDGTVVEVYVNPHDY